MPHAGGISHPPVVGHATTKRHIAPVYQTHAHGFGYGGLALGFYGASYSRYYYPYYPYNYYYPYDYYYATDATYPVAGQMIYPATDAPPVVPYDQTNPALSSPVDLVPPIDSGVMEDRPVPSRTLIPRLLLPSREAPETLPEESKPPTEDAGARSASPHGHAEKR